MELKGLAERGSPFKAHQVAVCPGEKLSEKLPPAYYSPGPDDETLVFESRFEGGNLQLAVKREDGYDLLLQNDINTLGHTQCRRSSCRVLLPSEEHQKSLTRSFSHAEPGQARLSL